MIYNQPLMYSPWRKSPDSPQTHSGSVPWLAPFSKKQWLLEAAVAEERLHAFGSAS